MSSLLFETPWWLLVVLAGVGIFVFMTGNRRQETPVMRAGLAILLLAIAMALVSYFVQTPRERAMSRSKGLVYAVNQRDWTKFHSLIDKQTSVYGIRGPDAITDAAKQAAEQYQLGQIRITGDNVKQTDTVIVVTLRLLSEQFGQSGVSDWEFQYQNLGQGWFLYTVQVVGGIGVDERRIREGLRRELDMK